MCCDANFYYKTAASVACANVLTEGGRKGLQKLTTSFVPSAVALLAAACVSRWLLSAITGEVKDAGWGQSCAGAPRVHAAERMVEEETTRADLSPPTADGPLLPLRSVMSLLAVSMIRV
jgi:hypothetical protein